MTLAGAGAVGSDACGDPASHISEAHGTGGALGWTGEGVPCGRAKCHLVQLAGALMGVGPVWPELPVYQKKPALM